MHHCIVSIRVIVIILLLCSSCSTPKGQFRRITASDYVDKMKAGWIGQMVGVGWGAPTEAKFQGRIVPEDQMPDWEEDTINQFDQDDLYVEMTFLRTLDLYGFDVPIHQAGIDFANSQYRLWHANRAGREALRSGIAPPYSGHPQFNQHTDDIDYQIEADYSGLIAPGMPQTVHDLAQTFGRLMNYGDGLYGGQFVGAMYAEAFFEKDVEKIIRAGLAAIPEDSQYHECISDVLGWYHQHPDDWQKTWRLISEKYQDNPDYRRFSCSGQESFNIDVKINGAYVVLGMLYGKGDPDQTTIISTRAGHDSDCNPSSAAGVLFTTIGFSKLPEKFINRIDHQTKFSFTEYDFPGLIEVCLKLARQAILRSGGRIEANAAGEEVFLIPVSEVSPGPSEHSWDPEPAPEDIWFSDQEMKQITSMRGLAEGCINVWGVSGPYSREGVGAKGLFDTAFAPEQDVDLATWKSLPIDNDADGPWSIRLGTLAGGEDRVAYVRSEVWSDRPRDLILELGSDDGAKVWVNGDLLHENNQLHGIVPAEDRLGLSLTKGWNRIMLKLTQGSGDWKASVCLTEPEGSVPRGLRYR